MLLNVNNNINVNNDIHSDKINNLKKKKYKKNRNVSKRMKTISSNNDSNKKLYKTLKYKNDRDDEIIIINNDNDEITNSNSNKSIINSNIQRSSSNINVSVTNIKKSESSSRLLRLLKEAENTKLENEKILNLSGLKFHNEIKEKAMTLFKKRK